MDDLVEKARATRQLFDLTDQVAIVTGAGRGLGVAFALALAGAGAHLVLVGRTATVLERTAEQVRQLGRRALVVTADVGRLEDVERMVAEARAEFGRVDILVNNAGAVYLEPTTQFPVEKWEEVVRTNLEGPFLCCREVGRLMLEQGRGKIINISSVRGQQGRANDPAYAASKGAVNQLTRSLAIEWGQKGINVNAIAPVFTLTEMSAPSLEDPKTRDWVLGRIPMGRVGQLEDLFGAVVFLASHASDFITGQVIYVDGGWTAA